SCTSQSTCTPLALTTRCAASVTSGPMPSPGIRVSRYLPTLCLPVDGVLPRNDEVIYSRHPAAGKPPSTGASGRRGGLAALLETVLGVPYGVLEDPRFAAAREPDALEPPGRAAGQPDPVVLVGRVASLEHAAETVVAAVDQA